MSDTGPLSVPLTPEIKAAIERENGRRPEPPVEFKLGAGDVVIRRLSKKEAATPAVQARVDEWGRRMVNRTTALGTVKTVSEKLDELDRERVSVAEDLAARGEFVAMTGDDEGKLTPKAREERARHRERAERLVQIDSLIDQHQARLTSILDEGEPFEISVPVEMVGSFPPERIALQNGPDCEYGAIIDSIDKGVARSLRPANEFNDLARLTTHVVVSLRAPGTKPATERKTLRRS